MDSVQAEAMIRYVKEKILRKPNLNIGVDTPLVSSGMVDSFALVEALVELEASPICAFRPPKSPLLTWTRW